MSPSTPSQPLTVLLAQGTYEGERVALRALRWCDPPILVRVARDGEIARRSLGLSEPLEHERRTTPGLVLCDLKLPELDGDQILRLARAESRLAHVPFVILSRAPSPSEIERCRRWGVSAFLQKPTTYEACLGLYHAVVDWATGRRDASVLTPFSPYVPRPDDRWRIA